MKILYIADKELVDKAERLEQELNESENDCVILDAENDYLITVLSLFDAEYTCIKLCFDNYHHLYKTLRGILSKLDTETDEHRVSTIKGLLRSMDFYDEHLAKAVGEMQRTVMDMRQNVELPDYDDDDEEDDDLL